MGFNGLKNNYYRIFCLRIYICFEGYFTMYSLKLNKIVEENNKMGRLLCSQIGVTNIVNGYNSQSNLQ